MPFCSKCLLIVLLLSAFAYSQSMKKKCRIIIEEEEKAMMAEQDMAKSLSQVTSKEELLETTVKSYNEAVIRWVKLYDIVFERKTKKEDMPLVTAEEAQSGEGLLKIIGGNMYKNEIARYYITFCE